MLIQNEFEILSSFAREKKHLSQREVAKMTNLSLGSVNNIIGRLQDSGYLADGMITDAGYDALQPYKVKRAVFLAAGFGSRMVPITLNTPKPLVFVNGKRIIETTLDAVVKAGIEEIYIVTGYLNDNFDILLKKYPNIKLIYNAKYNEANNIASAYLVRDKFKSAYMLDADLYLKNENLIRTYEYHSNYLGIKVDRTDDWCVETKQGIITNEKLGGVNCYQMAGIAYYDEQDGIKLEKDIEDVYNMPGGKEVFSEQVAMIYRRQNYQIHIRECHMGDIVEIDTFNELKKIDKAYDV